MNDLDQAKLRLMHMNIRCHLGKVSLSSPMNYFSKALITGVVVIAYSSLTGLSL